MTEAEYHRAAFGTPDGVQREFPWGDASPRPDHGTFDFSSWDPVPVGSSPGGASAWGVPALPWAVWVEAGWIGYSAISTATAASIAASFSLTISMSSLVSSAPPDRIPA